MNALAKFDVIVCGSLHLDVVVDAPTIPRIDETSVGSRWQQICGGKGGNQAVHAAKSGAKTAMIGRVGKDGFGETLFSNLNTARVDTSAVLIDEKTGSGMSVAIVQSNGEYGAVIVSGANLEIEPSAISAQWDKLGGAKILVLQNEVPQPVNITAAAVARTAGAMVVLNAAPARPLTPDLAELVDVLVVNRVEAEMIAGLPVADRQSAINCLSKLGSDKRSVIITLGGAGIVLQEPHGPVIEVEPISVIVTSTHGAGDCFIGALSSELAKGQGLETSCRIANAQAAAFVSRKLK